MTNIEISASEGNKKLIRVTFTSFAVHEAETPRASTKVTTRIIDALSTATSIVHSTFVNICNIYYTGSQSGQLTKNYQFLYIAIAYSVVFGFSGLF